MDQRWASFPDVASALNQSWLNHVNLINSRYHLSIFLRKARYSRRVHIMHIGIDCVASEIGVAVLNAHVTPYLSHVIFVAYILVEITNKPHYIGPPPPPER